MTRCVDKPLWTSIKRDDRNANHRTRWTAADHDRLMEEHPTYSLCLPLPNPISSARPLRIKACLSFCDLAFRFIAYISNQKRPAPAIGAASKF